MDGPLFFGKRGGGGGEWGVGMKNIEKNCLQGLKRQNKLLATTKCVKKLVCISKKKMLQGCTLQENNGPSLSTFWPHGKLYSFIRILQDRLISIAISKINQGLAYRAFLSSSACSLVRDGEGGGGGLGVGGCR